MNANTPQPSEIKLHQKSRVLEISFADCKTFQLPCEFLRVYSPSAEVRGHGSGQEVLQAGKKNVEITHIEPVGSYAIQLTFVMMIPIPRRGIYHGLEGLAAVQSVPGVTGVSITVELGQIIAPPPDGASYLGFIFARAASPAEAENALRIAHRQLHFDIRPEYPATVAPGAWRP
jgi:DUF971 family protein